MSRVFLHRIQPDRVVMAILMLNALTTPTQAQPLAQQRRVSRSPSVFFMANPNTIQPGQCSMLTWKAIDAVAVEIHGLGRVDLSGSRRVCPETTTLYRITASSAIGSASSTARVSTMVSKAGGAATRRRSTSRLIPKTAQPRREVKPRAKSETRPGRQTRAAEQIPTSKQRLVTGRTAGSGPTLKRRMSKAVIDQPQKSSASDEVFDTYLTALVASGDGAGLAESIGGRLDRETDPRRLQRFANLALQLNQSATARRVYQKLLAINDKDPDALRWLGGFAFQQARYRRAKKLLSRYFAGGGKDYRSHYYFGELMHREGDRSTAEFHYRRAFHQIEKSSPRPYAMRLTRALLLNRLGRVRESFSAFEELMKEHPGDKNLRADYVSVLIDRGRHAEAQAILSMPE